MTLGRKLKAARQQAGLSQQELAKKLNVSRQAITKWENDRGVPDIENLKSLARLFDVSIDYFVGNGREFSARVVREPIDLAQYEATGKARSRSDAAVRAQYPDAETIRPLTRGKRLSFWEWVVDFIVQPGVLNTASALRDLSAYYVVDLGDRHLLVNITREFIESRELATKFEGRKQAIGDNVFVKAPYAL